MSGKLYVRRGAGRSLLSSSLRIQGPISLYFLEYGPAMENTPADSSVQLWLVTLDDLSDPVRRRCAALLSPCEIVKLSRFKASEARDQYLVTRALVRKALSRYAGISEDKWVFGAGSFGRPYIQEPKAYAAINYNASHTEGLVGLAVSATGTVGFDVEKVRQIDDLKYLAQKIFVDSERHCLYSRDCAEVMGEFFSIWTLKEAYLKALGTGLSIPLESFGFSFHGGYPQLQIVSEMAKSGVAWQFHQLKPSEHHRAAVAVTGDIVNLKLQQQMITVCELIEWGD